jgi:hypothetical protein
MANFFQRVGVVPCYFLLSQEPSRKLFRAGMIDVDISFGNMELTITKWVESLASRKQYEVLIICRYLLIIRFSLFTM